MRARECANQCALERVRLLRLPARIPVRSAVKASRRSSDIQDVSRPSDFDAGTQQQVREHGRCSWEPTATWSRAGGRFSTRFRPVPVDRARAGDKGENGDLRVNRTANRSAADSQHAGRRIALDR